MTNYSATHSTEGANSSGTPQDAGQCLRLARTNLGLSQKDAARQSKISLELLCSLENGYLNSDLAPVFLRGHVASYCRLLGRSVEETLDAFRLGEFLRPELVSTPPELSMARRLAQRSVLRLSYLLVSMIVVAPMLFWYAKGPIASLFPVQMPAQQKASGLTTPGFGATGSGETDHIFSEGLENAGRSTDTGREVLASMVGFSSAMLPSVVESRKRTEPSPADRAKTPELQALEIGYVKLDLTLNGESWVEVRDANGENLVLQLLPALSQKSVAGMAPLQVVIGNAPGATVLVDGQKFFLSAYTHDKVARFEIGRN